MTFTTNNLEGVFTTSISSDLVQFIDDKLENPNPMNPVNLHHCIGFVYDRGVILTPAVIEQIECIFRFTTTNP
tara:strand:- start:181 stop:399 length:219 start_codon:yes stop_codon:yes gene_type:complete